jgi:hypothetical protein
MLVGLCKKLVDHTTHNRGIRVGQALMNDCHIVLRAPMYLCDLKKGLAKSDNAFISAFVLCNLYF